MDAAVILVVFTIAFPGPSCLLCTTCYFAFSQVVPCTRIGNQLASFQNLFAVCCTECCNWRQQHAEISVWTMESSYFCFFVSTNSCNLLQDVALLSISVAPAVLGGSGVLWYLADMSKTDVRFAGMLQIQPAGLEPCRSG